MSKNVLHPVYLFLSLAVWLLACIFSINTLLSYSKKRHIFKEQARLLSELKQVENTFNIDRFFDKISSLELCNKEKNQLEQLNKVGLINAEGLAKLARLQKQKISFHRDNGTWKMKEKITVENEDLEKLITLFANHPFFKITQLHIENICSEQSENTSIQCYIEFQNT